MENIFDRFNLQTNIKNVCSFFIVCTQWRRIVTAGKHLNRMWFSYGRHYFLKTDRNRFRERKKHDRHGRSWNNILKCHINVVERNGLCDLSGWTKLCRILTEPYNGFFISIHWHTAGFRAVKCSSCTLLIPRNASQKIRSV